VLTSTAGGDAIFTFADDKLILIHTRGQADNLRPDMEPDAQFEDFDVYMPQQIIVNVKTGQSAVFGEVPVVPLSVGRSIDEVWLATKPAAQFQIDCFGYEQFDEGRLALRKDIPEIRMVSDEIAKIPVTLSE
jgi:hypothetical protein